MGFLKRFFRNVFREGAMPVGTSSFEHSRKRNWKRISAWLATEALCSPMRFGPPTICKWSPSKAIDTTPTATNRVEPASRFSWRRFQRKNSLKRSSISSIRSALLSTRSWKQATTAAANGHTDLYREHIDLPVLKSILYEYEELLTNDGCTGLAVLNPDIPLEIQFDEHKLLIIYGDQLTEFESVLRDHGVLCEEGMKFITEAEHVHSSSDSYARTFEELQTRLGMDCDF